MPWSSRDHDLIPSGRIWYRINLNWQLAVGITYYPGARTLLIELGPLSLEINFEDN